MHRNDHAPGSRDAGPDHAVVDGPSEGVVAARDIFVLAEGDHSGNLTAKSSVEVHGRVHGTVRGGVVRIHQGATVEGEVHAGHLYVDGGVAGLCHAVKLQAGPGAAIAGVVVADSIASSDAAISAVACVAPGNYVDRDLVARARALIADEGVAHDPLAMRGHSRAPAAPPAPAWPVAGEPADGLADASTGAASPRLDEVAGMVDVEDDSDGREWPRTNGYYGAHGVDDGRMPRDYVPGVDPAADPAEDAAEDAAPAHERSGTQPPEGPVRHHARVRDLPPSPDSIDLAASVVDVSAPDPAAAIPVDGTLPEGVVRPGLSEAPESGTLPTRPAADATDVPDVPVPDGAVPRAPGQKTGFRAKRRPSAVDGASLPAAVAPVIDAAPEGPGPASRPGPAPEATPPVAAPAPEAAPADAGAPQRPRRSLDPASAIDALDDYFAPPRREDPRIAALADAMRASDVGGGPVVADGAVGRHAAGRPAGGGSEGAVAGAGAEVARADADADASRPRAGRREDPPAEAARGVAAAPWVKPFLIAPRDR